ncbi:hypothetical protein M0812_26258 [Anaeramoeba flamelloides]|uniref:Uncharacterized protein n=1 Tax=Anaeramoeba flamelloides TaxID=1746091 RepID=A0AAV7YDQ5_9EUKA|nr:hypothetical protein M0812_26258 [Anaeramoeba flamelloides]
MNQTEPKQRLFKRTKLRTKTKNQKRIEKLLRDYPTAVQGLNKTMLQLPNCPKEVLVSTAIIDFENDHKNNKNNTSIKRQVTKRELHIFMIKKFNIFLDHSSEKEQGAKPSDQWVKFKYAAQKNMDSLITLIDSDEFEKELGTITRRLRYWYEQDSTHFQGVEPAHLSDSYRIPNNVNIDKDKLKKFCTEDSTIDTSSQIKKVYRAFSFFFLARFNCINATNKNRKNMIFRRNYDFGSGDSQISMFQVGEQNSKLEKKNTFKKKSSGKTTKTKRRKRRITKRHSSSQKLTDQEDSYSSSSSGEEIERETILPQKQLRTKERRIVLTKDRSNSNEMRSQNDDENFSYLQQLHTKTDQELEGELVWLLVNLKSHYRN